MDADDERDSLAKARWWEGWRKDFSFEEVVFLNV